MKPPEENSEVAPYESAARIYCGMIGLDPDGVMEVNHPFIVGAKTKLKHWTHAAERMLDMSRMMVAMKQASGAAKSEN